MKASEQKITIIGAGLVGALQALFLAQKGFEVEVFEKRPDPRKKGYLGGRSINLALSDRGLKALKTVGLDEKVKAITIPMFGRQMHDLDGTPTYQPYGKEGQAINSVPRGDLNIMLLEAADAHDNVSLHFNQKLREIDFKNKRLAFEAYATKEQTTKNYQFLLGTDGAFSKVRFALQKVPGINFEQRFISHGYKEFTIEAKNGDYQFELHEALHIWPRKDFMLIALPNHDKSFTCTLFLALEGKISFKALENYEDFKAFFKQNFADAFDKIDDFKGDFENNPTSHLVYTLANPWNYKDEVSLLGDAAHAIVPFYGQGMNAGFEDCTIFNDLLDQHGNDLAKVISLYSDHRVKDAQAICDLALYNFIEMRDKVADAEFLRTKKVEGFLHKHYPELWVPLYSLVTFSHTPYAQALEKGNKQRKIMQQVMKLEQIDDIAQNAEVQKKALELIKSLL